MKTATLISTAMLLALGGCQQPAPSNDQAATAKAAPAEKDYFADRINALNPKQRDAVLLKAIRDAGGECPGMTGSETHAAVRSRPAWIAHCSAGKVGRALDWVLILDSGGMMRIARPAALIPSGS